MLLPYVLLRKKKEKAQKKLSKTIQCQNSNTYYSEQGFERLTPFYEKSWERGWTNKITKKKIECNCILRGTKKNR